MFPTQAPRPIKRQRLMTPQTRGNVLVNAKVNSPQQQIMLPTSPISNGNGMGNTHGNGTTITTTTSVHGTGATVANGINGNGISSAGNVLVHNGNNGCNGINGEQNPTMYNTSNGQQHLLGPFKVYSKFTFIFLTPIYSTICGEPQVCACTYMFVHFVTFVQYLNVHIIDREIL